MRHLAPLLAALIAAGCGTRDNPETCSRAGEPCPAGKVCDVERRLCVPRASDAAADVGGPEAGRDLAGGDVSAAGDASDAPALDAPPDVAPDLLAPDARGTCGGDADCREPGQRFCVRGMCVACKESRDCTAEAPICSSSNACTSCATAATDDPRACSKRDPKAPVCHTPTGRCVECTIHGECGMDVGRPLCDPGARVCTSCAAAGGSPACAGKDASRPVCDANSGRCVECSASGDCKDPAKPICTGNVCERCVNDAQCAARAPNPGICLTHLGGRCATEAETIQVQNGPRCTRDRLTGGTAAAPFCESQDAIESLKPERRVVLIRGPVPATELSIAAQGAPVTVIGLDNATINPGARVGVRVSGADVTLRGLTISGGSDVGVVAENAAILRMNRCVVRNNGVGGIRVENAGFDIVNTVVERNSASGDVGGVRLGVVPPGAPNRFANNTVIANQNVAGVVCAEGTAHTIVGSILDGNVGPPSQVIRCLVTPCCAGAPGLNGFRLMPGSSCLDRLAPSEAPPDDIDGDPRPQGARSDCGADELR